MAALNTTFTKEDGTEVEIPFNGSGTSQQQNVMEHVEEHEESTNGAGGGGHVEEDDDDDVIVGGMTRFESLLLQATQKSSNRFINQLLHSDDFEVRRCSDGQVMSKGRCKTPQGGNQGGGASSEELQKALRDRDAARAEAEKLHENYSALFAAFNQAREAGNTIRMEYEDAREKLKMAAIECDEWQTKYQNVKDNANAELERASIEYESLVRTNEENTKGLRVRVKKMELDLAASQDEIRVLNKRNQELSAICDQLLNDVDGSDAVSIVSTDA